MPLTVIQLSKNASDTYMSLNLFNKTISYNSSFCLTITMCCSAVVYVQFMRVNTGIRNAYTLIFTQ